MFHVLRACAAATIRGLRFCRLTGCTFVSLRPGGASVFADLFIGPCRKDGLQADAAERTLCPFTPLHRQSYAINLIVNILQISFIG